MIIFPAIDLHKGEAVRLTQGDYKQVEVFFHNPQEALAFFEANNATHLHIVDLDGASEGTGINTATIEQLKRNSQLFIQVGGGIRNEDHIKHYLDCGVERVILGTVAVQDPDFLARMLAKYGDKIAVSIDARDGKVAVKGWKEMTTIDAFDYCAQLDKAGLATLIFTDISKDGKLEGTNLAAYRQLNQLNCQVIASGGVSFVHEIEELAKMEMYGAIVGRAIYTGHLDLKEIQLLAQQHTI